MPKFAPAPIKFAPLKLSEADVTLQIKGFLEARQWRAVRMGRGMMANSYGQVSSFGEPGVPDWLFLRYVDNPSIPGACVALWVEMKSRGAKPKCRCATKKKGQRCTACDQRTWRERERRRGAQVWTIDELDMFIRAYNATFGYLHRGPMATGQLELGGLGGRA